MHGAAEEGDVIPGHLDLIKLSFVKLIFNTVDWEIFVSKKFSSINFNDEN